MAVPASAKLLRVVSRSLSYRLPKVSEYLSLFVDDNMKKSLKGKSDTEIEE